MAAAVSTATEKATNLMGKLKLDTSAPVAKKPTGTQNGSVDRKVVSCVPKPPYERTLTPLHQEGSNTNFCFLPNGYPSTAYYYGGIDGSMNEWEGYSSYVSPDGMEMQPPGVYGDLYHHGYGYTAYGSYPSPGSSVPTMGHDGQLYAPQHYQYPTTYYQAPAPYTPKQAPASRGEVSTSDTSDQPPIPVGTAKSKSNGAVNGNANGNSRSASPKPTQQNSSLANRSYDKGLLSSGHLSSAYQEPRFGFDGIRSPAQWFDAPAFHDGQHKQSNTCAVSSTVSNGGNSAYARNQNIRPLPHPTGLHVPRPTSGMGHAAPGIMNCMYTNNQMFPQSGNVLRTGLGFGSNLYDSRANGRWGGAMDSKYSPRGRYSGFYGYDNENFDGLSELNRGPRAGRFKTQKGLGATIEDSSVGPERDQFNREDFPEKYSDAKFFIIKSYSEDHVHKSIKYNVWASTLNGNKKLDAAYQEAQEKTGACPVFLLFSVNTSGQFVGVAEMVGPIDFNKTVEYWQQDKWTGCFPVKWHIVKDLPNNILKHITLEYNENKPVTNSRDTQEVKLEHGLEVLKLFIEYVSKTSILDDFGFYETRQKAMQEKRAKQQQLQNQIVDGKPAIVVDEKDKDGATWKPTGQASVESVAVLKKEAVQVVGLLERKPSDEKGVAALLELKPSYVNMVAVVAGEALKADKTVTEKCVVAIGGVANGC